MPVLPAAVVGLAVAAVAALLCFGPRLSLSPTPPWLHPLPGPAIEGVLLNAFPDVDTAGLSPARVAVVDELRTQFREQNRATFFAEGVEEPWCADFVSWIMNAAGHPLRNPNSGSWRIPGVATLQEFYESTGRFRTVDDGYLPRVGDVVIYDDPSPFQQHANIVVGYDDGTLTTIGGNELGGVRAHRFTLADDPGVLGFGVL